MSVSISYEVEVDAPQVMQRNKIKIKSHSISVQSRQISGTPPDDPVKQTSKDQLLANVLKDTYTKFKNFQLSEKEEADIYINLSRTKNEDLYVFINYILCGFLLALHTNIRKMSCNIIIVLPPVPEGKASNNDFGNKLLSRMRMMFDTEDDDDIQEKIRMMREYLPPKQNMDDLDSKTVDEFNRMIQRFEKVNQKRKIDLKKYYINEDRLFELALSCLTEVRSRNPEDNTKIKIVSKFRRICEDLVRLNTMDNESITFLKGGSANNNSRRSTKTLVETVLQNIKSHQNNLFKKHKIKRRINEPSLYETTENKYMQPEIKQTGTLLLKSHPDNTQHKEQLMQEGCFLIKPPNLFQFIPPYANIATDTLAANLMYVNEIAPVEVKFPTGTSCETNTNCMSNLICDRPNLQTAQRTCMIPSHQIVHKYDKQIIVDKSNIKKSDGKTYAIDGYQGQSQLVKELLENKDLEFIFEELEHTPSKYQTLEESHVSKRSDNEEEDTERTALWILETKNPQRIKKKQTYRIKKSKDEYGFFRLATNPRSNRKCPPLQYKTVVPISNKSKGSNMISVSKMNNISRFNDKFEYNKSLRYIITIRATVKEGSFKKSDLTNLVDNADRCQAYAFARLLRTDTFRILSSLHDEEYKANENDVLRSMLKCIPNSMECSLIEIENTATPIGYMPASQPLPCICKHGCIFILTDHWHSVNKDNYDNQEVIHARSRKSSMPKTYVVFNCDEDQTNKIKPGVVIVIDDNVAFEHKIKDDINGETCSNESEIVWIESGLSKNGDSVTLHQPRLIVWPLTDENMSIPPYDATKCVHIEDKITVNTNLIEKWSGPLINGPTKYMQNQKSNSQKMPICKSVEPYEMLQKFEHADIAINVLERGRNVSGGERAELDTICRKHERYIASDICKQSSD